jgi:hypothetical protein
MGLLAKPVALLQATPAAVEVAPPSKFNLAKPLDRNAVEECAHLQPVSRRTVQ